MENFADLEVPYEKEKKAARDGDVADSGSAEHKRDRAGDSLKGKRPPGRPLPV